MEPRKLVWECAEQGPENQELVSKVSYRWLWLACGQYTDLCFQLSF